jgi:hypothetical protein
VGTVPPAPRRHRPAWGGGASDAAPGGRAGSALGNCLDRSSEARAVSSAPTNTPLAHYIKDVLEVTANGMAQVEQLFDKLDAGEQVVQ